MDEEGWDSVVPSGATLRAADDRARRRAWFLLLAVAVLAVACGAVVYLRMDHSGPLAPEPAKWVLADPASLNPDTTKIDVIIYEAACSGGTTAEDRVVKSVKYSDDAVTIDLGVRPVKAASCPGNPPTPYVVELDQPLGSRDIVGDIPSAP